MIDTLYTTYAALKELVAANGNVLTVKMEALRNVHGAGKLGVHVRAGISAELHKQGLGHFPDDLPNYYWDEVRLFTQGTQVSRLIEAARAVGEDHDELIRELVQSDAGETLQKVRELVCS